MRRCSPNDKHVYATVSSAWPKQGSNVIWGHGGTYIPCHNVDPIRVQEEYKHKIYIQNSATTASLCTSMAQVFWLRSDKKHVHFSWRVKCCLRTKMCLMYWMKMNVLYDVWFIWDTDLRQPCSDANEGYHRFLLYLFYMPGMSKERTISMETTLATQRMMW